MSMFESIVVILLLTMLIIIFLVAKCLTVIMINMRAINREIGHHSVVNLELKFIRFLHLMVMNKTRVVSIIWVGFLNI